ncbi:xyloside transporter [Klebsiella pneumoniae]|uniref:Xyloside transporter n=1 Tax=Klebsiella pneumoniae TaxID=573 RepID=A0A2X3HIF0_KLEPN|nr:xyloside transporter [Klebsiella pneumoniae]
MWINEPQKAGKYRPWLLRAGVPLVILSALLFAANPWGERFGGFRLYYLSGALDLVYSLVNIPYGSLNASLTRDPESIDKLTSTRMMLANSANLLVYTLFPDVCADGGAERSQPGKTPAFLALS